uniref:Phosphatidylinositol-3-phosphatase SAC1 n=1 Tax=Glossina pallidipes TaxID=7398 RepID=A0A1B0AHI7_GLOPL
MITPADRPLYKCSRLTSRHANVQREHDLIDKIYCECQELYTRLKTCHNNLESIAAKNLYLLCSKTQGQLESDCNVEEFLLSLSDDEQKQKCNKHLIDVYETICSEVYEGMKISNKAVSTQKGVFRTNCIDCLDRTNVVRSMLARRSLQKTLEKLGILHPSQKIELTSPNFELIFKAVWADNADLISMQYSGTRALKTDFTRTGKRTKRGLLQDGVNALTRYYINNFTDGFRQDGIDLFLGRYVVTNPFWAPLEVKHSRRYNAFPSILVFAVAMLYITALMPPNFKTENLLFMLFSGALIAVSATEYLYNEMTANNTINPTERLPSVIGKVQKNRPISEHSRNQWEMEYNASLCDQRTFAHTPLFEVELHLSDIKICFKPSFEENEKNNFQQFFNQLIDDIKETYKYLLRSFDGDSLLSQFKNSNEIAILRAEVEAWEINSTASGSVTKSGLYINLFTFYNSDNDFQVPSS